MIEKLQTVLVCYTQAVFENLEPEEPEDESDESLQAVRQIPGLATALAAALRVAGIETDVVKVPQRSFQPRDITKAAFGWRLMDLKESNGRTIDMVICLDFPAWSITHPHKVSWLNTLPNFVSRRTSSTAPKATEGNGSNVEFAGNINSLLQSERRGLSESWKLLAGSRAVAEELSRSGLPVVFNPFPSPEATPESQEWQAVIKRLLMLVSKS
jgi:hypothetical protein